MVESRVAQDTSHIVGENPKWAFPPRPSDEMLAKFFKKEALDFAPTDIDCFITNSKGASQRLIFNEPLALKDHEITHLQNFRQYLKENKLTIPKG
jgi:hypothetical protein